jgi:hypothetical protein
MKILNLILFAGCINLFSFPVYKIKYIQIQNTRFDTLSELIAIKNQFKKINVEINSYNKVHKDVYEESSEGSSLDAFYDNKSNIKKSIGTFYGETGKIYIEYYYTDERKVFFIFSKETNYLKPIFLDSSGKIKSVVENRYYFYNENLFKWISNSKINSHVSKKFKIKSLNLNKDIKNEKILWRIK